MKHYKATILTQTQQWCSTPLTTPWLQIEAQALNADPKLILSASMLLLFYQK